MEPAAETDDGVLTLRALVEDIGPSGLLALLAGVAILVYGISLAWRGGPRPMALALFALSWTALLPALGAGPADVTRTIVRLQLRWSMPGAGAVSLAVRGPGGMHESGPLLGASIGLFLGLVGSVAALSRSRLSPPRPRA